MYDFVRRKGGLIVFCVSGLFLKITPYEIKIESENEDFLEVD